MKIVVDKHYLIWDSTHMQQLITKEENEMFDINGGLLNALIVIINILTIIMIVVMPYIFAAFVFERSKLFAASLSMIGLLIYCFIIYVANPGMSFWKVV